MSDQHQADRDRASARAGLRDLARGKKPKPGTCRGCGASILWTVTAAGKSTPLDPKPVSGIDIETGEVRTIWISHFKTCPKAGDFRRPRQPELGLTAPIKRWPAGTGVMAVIDEELEPAYQTEDELMTADERAERFRGARVGGDVLRGLVHHLLIQGAAPASVELGEPGARARLTRFLTYRVLGLPVLVQTSTQSHPPAAWVARNPRLLAAVEERIET